SRHSLPFKSLSSWHRMPAHGYVYVAAADAANQELETARGHVPERERIDLLWPRTTLGLQEHDGGLDERLSERDRVLLVRIRHGRHCQRPRLSSRPQQRIRAPTTRPRGQRFTLRVVRLGHDVASVTRIAEARLLGRVRPRRGCLR